MVIPKLKLSNRGLFDADCNSFLNANKIDFGGITYIMIKPYSIRP